MLLGMIQNKHKQESAKLKFIPICRMPAAMNSFQPALGCFILPTPSGAGGRTFTLLPQLILLEFTAQWGRRVRIRSAMTGRPSHTVLLTYLSSFRSRQQPTGALWSRKSIGQEKGERQQSRNLWWRKPHGRGFAAAFHDWPKSPTPRKCASQRYRIF